MRSMPGMASLRPGSRSFIVGASWDGRADRGRFSERRYAGRGGGVLDRHGEPDTDEYALFAGVQDGRDDADDLAVHRGQRAARITGIRRRIELYQIGQQTLALARAMLALEPGHLAGRGRRADAERKSDDEHVVAHGQIARRAQ